MKRHLIIDVANSVQWTDEEKAEFTANLKKQYSEFECLVIFSESEETTFQILGETNKTNEEFIKEIINLKDIESEVNIAIASLKAHTNKYCHSLDYGAYECELLGIKRVNLLASLLAIHKEYILQNLEDKPNFVKQD